MFTYFLTSPWIDQMDVLCSNRFTLREMFLPVAVPVSLNRRDILTKSNERTEHSFESNPPICLTFQSTCALVRADLSVVCTTCFPLAIPSPNRNRTCAIISLFLLDPRMNIRTCYTMRFQPYDKIASSKASCGYRVRAYYSMSGIR